MVPLAQVVPVIVVDVMPASAPVEQAQLMLDACSQAVGSGGCQLAGAVPESTRPESVAVVLWQDAELLHATVRVGRRDREWITRQLSFAADDPVPDRWTTVGLTVATLNDETRTPEPAVPEPSAVIHPTSAASAHTPGSESLVPPIVADIRPACCAMTVGAFLGNGWDRGGLQTGAWASIASSWPHLPLFGFGAVSYGASHGPDLAGAGSLDSRWTSVSFGAGVETWLTAVKLRLYGAPEVALQFVSATLGNADGKLFDRELELRLRAGVVWQPFTHFGLTLGGTVRVLPFEAEAGDPQRARAGTGFQVLAGVEARR